MNSESFAERERRGLNKLINFRLPRYFYHIGLILAAGAIIMMFIRAFAMEGEHETLKDVLRKLLLIGMLLMSVARDKEEDELTIKLRMQSYTYAFITGVIYALIMPYVDYGVSNVLKPEGEALKDLGDFQVLLFMLLVQLMCYHALKRFR